MLAFFDQYAYSNSLWSPDSQSLVFAGQVASDDVDRIFVMEVDEPSTIQAIAEGSLAFWSWN